MDSEPHRHYVDTNVMVLPLEADYIEQAVDTYIQGYKIPQTYLDHPECMNAVKFAESLKHFPEGQFMALDTTTDRVVGVSSSMIVRFDPSQPLMESWCETTADGTLRTHDPDGDWLYGVDSVVLHAYRGKGIGGRLIKARYNLARRLNLRGMIAGSMPIDFHKASAEGVNIQAYVDDVLAGRRWDTNLSKQVKKGFRVHNIIPDYLMDAPSTRNYAVAILWDNPAYRPARGVSQRTQRPGRGTTTQPNSIQPKA